MASPGRTNDTGSRARVFAAAAAEFAARGYAGANMDRIARTARLNKAMIYYHFPSKAALYRAILRDMFDAVRARLDVLSECAPEWRRSVARWRRLNHRHRATVKGRLAPDTNTEYLIYQTLIGIWPAPRSGRRIDDLPDRAWFENAKARLEQYMLKAVREAKTRTSWTEPDEGYESALERFIDAILAGGDDAPFLSDVARFVARIATLGHWNALARVLLHATAPGITDTYQGDELWMFALVDPDNRRAVDYKRRNELLAAISAPGSLRALHPSDERLKLGIVQRVLNIRRSHAALFRGGSYTPLDVRGPQPGRRRAGGHRHTDPGARQRTGPHPGPGRAGASG